MTLLAEDAARQALTSTDWDVHDGKLVLVVKKKNFAEAIAFVNRVAEVAEARNHHPDIAVSWDTVTLTQWSHSAGGITQADVDLARAVTTLL